MRQIDSFLDSIYQKLDSKCKEVQELKLEMKSHLLETVYELKLAGKTEQEAIKIAINRFGGEKEIRIALGKWFNKRKKVANLFHYCALIILILGLGLTVMIVSYEVINYMERKNLYTNVSSVLSEGEKVSQENHEKVQSWIHHSTHISTVRVYNLKNTDNVFDRLDTPDFQYKQEIWAPEARFIDLFREGEGDANWFIYITYRSLENLAIIIFLVSVTMSISLALLSKAIHDYDKRNTILQQVRSLFN